MKILRIKFENINSLKGRHIIDFTEKPLLTSGLFAITGPTGSGKSTILDVITLALFNRIPRISEKITKTVIDKTGLILTRNMNSCSAQVTYQSIAGVFTSTWSIECARTGNLKDYEMSLVREDNSLFDLKKGDVPAKNEELIGLNFDQFIKAIILAQGDFAAFMKAKAGEREKLLEQVTGSWIYRAIGKAAFIKNKLVGQELERLTAEEQQHKSRMLEEAAYEDLKNNLALCDAEISKLTAHITTLKAEKKLKEDIRNLISAITAQEDNETEILIKQRQFFELNGTKLEKHRKLVPVQEKLWKWKQMGDLIEVDSQNLATRRQDLKNCEDSNKLIAKEVRELTGSEDEIPKALSEFETKVLTLENQRADRDTRISAKRNVVTKVAGELSLDIDVANLEAAGIVIEDTISEIDSLLNGLRGKLGENLVAKPFEELKKLKLISSEAHSYNTSKTLHDDRLKSLAGEASIAEKYQKEVAELPNIIDKAREKKNKAQLVFDNLEKECKIRDLTASLEDQRKKLREGEPCPLCGSADHPYAEGLPLFADDLDERTRKAKAENDKCTREVTSLETNISSKLQDLDKRKIKIAGLKKEVDALFSILNLILAKIPEDYRLLPPLEIIQAIDDKIEDLDRLISANGRKKKLDELKTDTRELARLVMESIEFEVKRKDVFKGKNVREVTSGFLARYTAGITLYDKLQKEEKDISGRLTKDIKDLKEEEKTLLLKLRDYQCIKDALADLIDGDEYQKLEAEDKKLGDDLSSAKAVLKATRKNLSELKLKDTKREEAGIDEEIETTNNTLVEKNLSRDSMVTRKNVHDEASAKLTKIASDIQEQRNMNEKWMLLDKYIGDAEGKRFSVFAQQLTLFQLVKLANKRLAVLNDRYMLDIPEDQEDDSLVIIDRHMGDLRRSVKSLSGGESFLVSLSLALALSDLASRQVEIKSLFIDEGFGSLDKLTLDQTIDTLERLQNETSKTIGVISHIEAMQERITTQIKLTRNGQGYSTVEIVC